MPTFVGGYGYSRWLAEQQAKQAQEQAKLRAQMGNWSVQDWAQYAQSGKSKGATRFSWGGGWLNPEDYSMMTWSQRQAMTDEMKKAFEEAKGANEQRYAEILAGYQNRYAQAEQGLEGLVQSAKSDIQRRYAVENSRAMQQLLNSGLLTTTVAPAVSRQITAQETRDIADLNERLRRERLGLLTQLSGEKLSFMERREDTYPQLQAYYELLRQLGAA